MRKYHAQFLEGVNVVTRSPYSALNSPGGNSGCAGEPKGQGEWDSRILGSGAWLRVVRR